VDTETSAVQPPSKIATRRGPSNKFRAAVLAILAAIFVLVFYAAEIEPSWIEVTHYHVTAPISPPIKIAHLTDLHTLELGRPERRLLELLAEEKPDVIVITGDVTHNDGRIEDSRALLERLHAPLGVWMVRGNWELWRPAEDAGEFFHSLGIHYLVNENAQLREELWLVGLDDPRAGHPDPERARAGVPAGAYTITLVHAPVIFDALVNRTNLVLAGHTHGGQVRLPFLPPLWLPGGAGGYVQGWYAKAGTRMYVSRGIGMSVLPVRFLCRPELTILTLGK
jgi:predicted MPP superfamily phosphohydrolase